MNIKVVGNKKVMYLGGEINITTGAEMKKAIIEQFRDTDIVVLSFRDVVYMNSSGLRDIIETYKESQKQKKQIILCEMPADIAEMFSFTGLNKVFTIYETEAEAVG